MNERIYGLLVDLMNIVTDVMHWIELREEAKENFPPEYINRLDGSGLINEVLK